MIHETHARQLAMNLAIDALALLSPSTGIARYTRELVSQFMSRAELRPFLHYGLRWSTGLREAPMPGIVSAKDAFKRVVPQSYEVLRAMRQVSFFLGAKRRHIDLYHAPNFLPLRFHGPTVITVHDLSFMRYPQTHPKERVRVMERRLPEAISSSQFVLVDSEFVRGEVIEVYGAPVEKVVTTHLGVSERFRPMFPQETRPVLEKYGLAHGRYILSVGTLEPRKNLAGTLEAFALLPPQLRNAYPLALVGMTGWKMEHMSARIDALATEGHVKPMGYVADDDLPYLYAGAAAFIYPSIYEGFGLPVLEALATGTPVVTSNRASLKEVAGKEAATLDPDDFPGLSAALHEALEAGGGMPARERRIAWARSFTWQRCAEQTVAVYRRALSGSAPAHR
jgi:glycosyltransferase involved in cell wall biosynthesis